MRLRRIKPGYNLLIAILAATIGVGLTAGCSVLGRTPVPTPFPDDFIETAIKMTIEAGELSTSAAILNPATPEATETPIPQSPRQNPGSSEATPTQDNTGAANPPDLPTDTPGNPTATALISPTPGIPEAAVQINSPGPMSKITSPLNVTGSLNTEPDGHMQIEVWLEPLTADGPGRLLLRQLQNFIDDPTPRIYVAREFEIEISRLSEFAQLRASTYDAENRLVALSSVDLLLLAVGDTEINPPGNLQETIVILEPGDNKLIQAGRRMCRSARPTGDQILTISMTAPMVSHRLRDTQPSPDRVAVPSAEVPYYVSDHTCAPGGL
jgi:hypothetical protein